MTSLYDAPFLTARNPRTLEADELLCKSMSESQDEVLLIHQGRVLSVNGLQGGHTSSFGVILLLQILI